jgi:serine/threonine protein kinase
MNPGTDQPKFIAHYRVARLLGSGGMGEVFLAEDTKLDRSVALKLLPKEVAADASRRKRFLAEAKAASALNHSSVCTIYEVVERRPLLRPHSRGSAVCGVAPQNWIAPMRFLK